MTTPDFTMPSTQPNRYWTRAEESALREWCALSNAEIAARLGRTRQAVVRKRAQLGLNVAPTFAERFEAKVDRSAGPDGCHLWTASRFDAGYGKIGIDGHRIDYAHRVAWEMARGPIPDGAIVCHSCDNPPCVNLQHLFLGTHGTNSDDKLAKGREARGEGNGQAKLTDEAVARMRELRTTTRTTYHEIARQFGVSREVARRAILGVTWSHV